MSRLFYLYVVQTLKIEDFGQLSHFNIWGNGYAADTLNRSVVWIKSKMICYLRPSLIKQCVLNSKSKSSYLDLFWTNFHLNFSRSSASTATSRPTSRTRLTRTRPGSTTRTWSRSTCASFAESPSLQRFWSFDFMGFQLQTIRVICKKINNS